MLNGAPNKGLSGFHPPFALSVSKGRKYFEIKIFLLKGGT